MFHNHHHHWHFLLRHELGSVYFSVALRAFALSLLGIFVPLYLMKDQGFSLQQTLGAYLFYAVVLALSTPLAAAFSARFGMKHAVLLSAPLYLGFLFFLYFLPVHRVSLLFPAAFLGLSIAFYWMGMHQVMYRLSTKKHRGEALGKQKAITILGTIAGPLTGGFIISSFGFSPLFAIAAGILLLSAGILFLNKDGHAPYHFSFRSLVPGKPEWKNSLFFASQGTRVIAEGVLWPIFVFFLLNNYLSLGFLGTLLSGIGASLLWFMGMASDHHNRRRLVRWVTPLESVSWFLRSLVVTFPQILGATIFGAIIGGIREVPLSALEYDKARGEITSYFVYREIFICLGRVFLLTLVLMTDSLAGGLFFQGLANFAVFLF